MDQKDVIQEDKDLLAIGEYKGIKIRDPREFELQFE